MTIEEFIKDNFEPVEDKPWYVWFNKRNKQIVSIDVLVTAYLKAIESEE